jgi:predicted dehydrogenase
MIRMAIVGTGGMAQGHAKRLQEIKGSAVAACCDIAPGRAAAFAKRFNIPAAYENAEEMFKREKLDAISIVTVDAAHAPIALMAIRHGKHVMCEKPLADTLAAAGKMAVAAKKAGVLTGVNFSYRNAAATQKAAEIVASGALGKIIHVEGSYLQSWLTSNVWGDWRTKEAFLWRLSKKHGSAGVLGDVGVHLYDLASFVVGDFAEVACNLKTFDKGVRKVGPYVLDANDSMVTSVRFKNGAIGVLHASRWATGQVNTVAIRVYGEKGGLDLNLDRLDPEKLRICVGRKNVDKALWTAVKCPKVPDMLQRFVTSIQKGRQGQTSFAGGLEVQRYLDASFTSAEKGGVFLKI